MIDSADRIRMDECGAELSKLLFNNSRRAARYKVQTDDVGSMILNDSEVPMASLPPSKGWCSDADGSAWAANVDQSVFIWRLEGDFDCSLEHK